jgi:hypothetical protein
MISAIPLNQLAKLECDPPLEPEQIALCLGLSYGRAAKVATVIDDEPSIPSPTFGGSPLALARPRCGGIFCGFAFGEDARAGMSVLADDLRFLADLRSSRRERVETL